ncbi:MAG: hypothetical protein FWH48_05830, partial [Oscillospiraceae bacterium]|nr:hypothetical protein [Oscillospiraceae bacterium]
MAELSSRERVLRAVHGKDVDRTPRLFRAEAPVRDAITKAKGFADIYALYDHYGIDTQHIPVIYDKTKEVPCNFRDVHDANYIREFPFPGEGYVNVGDSLKIAESASASGRAVVGGVWASLFTHSRGLIGEERFLCSIYDEPELIEALVTWVTDMYISWNEQYLKACGKYIDIYYFGSDFGTQGSMFVSEEHYVRFFKENMRRIVASAKKYVDVVMFHTCGSVFDIIGHLIDIGVDILDPVQTGANKMQPG